jgi:hypothetical protein
MSLGELVDDSKLWIYALYIGELDDVDTSEM